MHLAGGSTMAVSSFNTRTGAVTSQTGDYAAAMVTNAADTSSTSTQSFSGELSAPSVAETIAGSTARFLGALSAPPASGSWNAGDFGVDPVNARILVCTVGGTPGS